MHPGAIAREIPDRPACIFEPGSEVVTYRELDEASNRCAHLFRSLGLRRGQSVALLAGNRRPFFEVCWAAQRAGLVYTPISTHLTAEEIAYIVNDCEAEVLVTTHDLASVAEKLASRTPRLRARLMAGGTAPGFDSYEAAVAAQPATPIADEQEGIEMLYSSGTTGRPKGVRHALPEGPMGTPPALARGFLAGMFGFGRDSVYLSPAPSYHAAPLRFVMAMHRLGATAVILRRFDPALALACIERHRVTHSQWVPTMFLRMLKLPEQERSRHDLSSHRVAIHAAAPCPVWLKERMIDWWGPILVEYYAATEGNGSTVITSEEWLAHRGSVGRAFGCAVHILDDDGNELPPGEVGTVYFEGGQSFEYHKDPGKTRRARSPQGWSTVGDMGYLDEDGYLYLTDRKADMIISGGVNIYPREAENVLLGHPEVADVAVFGVPNEEFGEEVKAVVEPVDFSRAGPELEAELIAYCRERLAHIKCPRSIDFERRLPRSETGKLYKRRIRERYWQGRATRIV